MPKNIVIPLNKLDKVLDEVIPFDVSLLVSYTKI